LTGAGCSTASGIPDYRGPLTRAKARNPVQHRDFIARVESRAQYWARSTVGWPRFNAFRPNGAHHALAQLEKQGVALGVITQNVDRLHQRAGSERVIELHGALAEVKCLSCSASESRDSLQHRLLALNPLFASLQVELAPDGDAELPRDAVEGFQIPDCLACGGVLKPDVVFFGDNVPKVRVEAAFAQLDEARALVVVGSSLEVYSGYRFVLRAQDRRMPIAIVNLGDTRGDTHATLRIDAPAAEVLSALVESL
jgi:NAD-dependent SIR2 family protein deacetylase